MMKNLCPEGRQRIVLGLRDQTARQGSVLTDALTVGGR